MATETNSVYRVDPAELPSEAVIFGSRSAMRAIRNRIDSALSSDLPVLIRGESGTGKEVIARFLHCRSHRYVAPFVRLNCAVAPAGLLESELFGCASGFIAGSPDGRQGLIEIAEGGTLFLDEIASLLLAMQGKRLERGRFIWPKAESGTVRLSRAQLSMLLEGIDWRRVDPRQGRRTQDEGS